MSSRKKRVAFETGINVPKIRLTVKKSRFSFEQKLGAFFFKRRSVFVSKTFLSKQAVKPRKFRKVKPFTAAARVFVTSAAPIAVSIVVSFFRSSSLTRVSENYYEPLTEYWLSENQNGENENENKNENEKNESVQRKNNELCELTTADLQKLSEKNAENENVENENVENVQNVENDENENDGKIEKNFSRFFTFSFPLSAPPIQKKKNRKLKIFKTFLKSAAFRSFSPSSVSFVISYLLNEKVLFDKDFTIWKNSIFYKFDSSDIRDEFRFNAKLNSIKKKIQTYAEFKMLVCHLIGIKASVT